MRPIVRVQLIMLVASVVAGAAVDAVTATRAAAQIPQASVAEPAVRVRGRGDPEHDRYLRQILEGTDRLLITRDTVIARNDTVRTRVVVVGATLRLDGVILGDLIGIGANLFVRPSARITGEVRNVAGGLYSSALATIAGPIENSPNAQYEIVRSDTLVTVLGTEHPSILELPGIKGLGIPTYDRVSGVTLRAGAGLILPRVGRAEPVVRAWGQYYSHRGDFGGGGEVAIKRGWTEIAAGAERTTLTNEEWIRKDMSNSFAMLLQGKDYRNYYAADRAFVRLDRTLEKGARTSIARLTAQVEDASPLRAGQPWSLFKPDSIRPNHYGTEPASTDGPAFIRNPNGRITSAIASLSTEWEAPRLVLKANGLAEVGTTALNGDHAFARFEMGGNVALPAIKDHTLRFEGYFQGPLPGTDSLPYQRWGFVGGSGTLHTFQVAAFPGDRIAFVETMYTVPLPERLSLPLLGRPGLDLLHAIAMAWKFDQNQRFEQNIGARLGYRIAYLRVLTNPRNFSDDIKVSVGVTLPRKAYPWQEPAPGK